MNNTHEAQSEMTKQDTLPPPDGVPGLVKGIHNAIAELAGISRYPDLTEAIDRLAALAAQAPQPLPKDASGWNGSFEQAWRMGHATCSREFTADAKAQLDREVRAAQAPQQALAALTENAEELGLYDEPRQAQTEPDEAAAFEAAWEARFQTAYYGQPKSICKADAFALWRFRAAAQAPAVEEEPQQAQGVPSRCARKGCNCANWLDEGCAWDMDAPQAEPRPEREPLSQAASDVLAERQRQISAEGWTPAASHRRNLVKAGALILAEIERLDRAAMLAARSEPSPEACGNCGETVASGGCGGLFYSDGKSCELLAARAEKGGAL